MSTSQLYTTHNLFLELCPILLCGYCLHCFYDVRILLKQEKSNSHFVAEVDLGWSKYSRRICSAELRTWDEWMKSLLSVPSLSTTFKKWWKCQVQYNKKASPMPFGRCFENQMLPLHTSRPHLSFKSSYIKPGVWTGKSSIPVSDPQVATSTKTKWSFW